MWIDNFSRNYGNRYLRNAVSAYQNCQWTVIAKHVLGLKLPKVHDETGELIPCLPQDLFQELDLLIATFAEIVVEEEYMSPESFVVRHRLYSCPPGVPEYRKDEFPELRTAFQMLPTPSNRTQTFVPLRVSDHNISSNVGLLQILTSLIELHNAENWLWVLCDINIFKRILKVR